MGWPCRWPDLDPMKLQVGALPGQLLFGATIGNAPPAQRARPVDIGYLAVGKKNFV